MFALNVQENLNDKELTNKFIMLLQVVLSSSIDGEEKILALLQLVNYCCYTVAISINNEYNECFWNLNAIEWMGGRRGTSNYQSVDYSLW